MVDVVAAEADAHQFLEQVRLFVAALGRPEAGRATCGPCCRGSLPGPARRGRAPRPSSASRNASRQLSGTRSKYGSLGPFLADQRHRQPIGAHRVVETVAALDAKPRMVSRAVPAVDEEDAVVGDVVGELAADAAERAKGIDLLLDLARRDLVGAGQLGHQRAGRAGLHAFAAGDAGGRAHRIVHVEDDLRSIAPPGVADDVVDLLLTAATHAAAALDTGIEVDGNARMARIRSAAARGRKIGLSTCLRAPPSSSIRSRSRCASPVHRPAGSSSTILRAEVARALSTCTFMPGCGARQQDGASTRSPSISTMHARQFPSGR